MADITLEEAKKKWAERMKEAGARWTGEKMEIPEEYKRMADYILEKGLINDFVEWKKQKLKEVVD